MMQEYKVTCGLIEMGLREERERENARQINREEKKTGKWRIGGAQTESPIKYTYTDRDDAPGNRGIVHKSRSARRDEAGGREIWIWL